MCNRLLSFFVLAMLAFSVGGFAANKKKPAAGKPGAKVAGKHATGKKGSAGKGKSSKSSMSGKLRKSGKSAVAATTWRNRQLAPSSERYREIQTALAQKGYLQSAPTGVWDASSIEAMKQFQTSRKMSPSGKVNSASLIGLGLGPKHNPGPPAVPNESPQVP